MYQRISLLPVILLSFCSSFAGSIADSLAPLFRLQGAKGYSDFCISEQERWVAAADDYGSIKIWKGNPRPYTEIRAGHFEGTLAIGICSDSSELITIGTDGYMHIFDLQVPVRKYRISIVKAIYAAIYPSGKYAAIVNSTGNLFIYDLVKARRNPDSCIVFTTTANPKVPVPIALSFDPNKIAVITLDKAIRLFDIRDTASNKLIQHANRFVQEVHFIGPELLLIKGYATGYSSLGNTGLPSAVENRTFVYDIETSDYIEMDKITSSRVFPAFRVAQTNGSGNILAISETSGYILVASPTGNLEFWETESYSNSL